MSEIDAAIGANVRLVRKAAGESQGDLAAAIGISRGAICKVENGLRPLRASELVLLARHWDVEVVGLLGEDFVELPSTEVAGAIIMTVAA
jgi:transcriptional regulator with XRE-family HTH domain